MVIKNCDIVLWFILHLMISLISSDSSQLSVVNSVHCPSQVNYPLQVVHHVTPNGNSSSGRFTKLSQYKSITECTQSCCQKYSCHVVFFYNQSCFHINCRNSRLCKPIKRSGPKFAHSDMVIVRDADDILTTLSDYNEFVDDGENDYSKQRRDDHIAPDESYVADEGDYVPSPKEEYSTVSLQASSACTIGLNDCPANELCHLQNHRHRQGICVCKKGYSRDSQKICQPEIDSTPQSPKSDYDSSNVAEESQAIDLSSNAGSVVVDNSLLYRNVSSTPSSAIHLVVSAGPNQTIELPKDETTLSAFVVPSSTTYKYEWQLLSHPTTGNEFGDMQGSNTANLKLTHLKAGNYSFKLSVTGDNNAFGSAIVNVSVLPPRRNNTPPVAVIKPANSTVQLPNKDTVLDGSYSTDDDKIVKYEWQAMTLPIGYKNLQLASSQTLQLKDLLPGLYQLRLIVTDSDGAINSTIANVTVLKEIDYPPTANAGPDVVLHLPQNEVTLYGNLSTDDKGITGWQWTREPDGDGKELLAVDMDGTSTPALHLSKLVLGVYKFVLKVTDTANQSSTAEVHVFVKPENNEPPVANAGDSFKVTLPLEQDLVLDGSHSHDDVGITKWLWEQIQGPKNVTIINPNSAKANISKLFPGEYVFRLTVWDSKGANSTSNLAVSVIQPKNIAPVAESGGDQEITFPVTEVILNGSKSSDDLEIVSYLWERTPESLAYGTIINNSSYSPILRLTNLITGRYVFKLTVTDAQGLSSFATASVIVKPPQDILNYVEVALNADIKSFTFDQQLNVLKKLELFLDKGEQIKIKLIKLDATTHTQRVIMIFVALKINGQIISGQQIVKQLKQSLKTDANLITPEVISLETYVCQNECSNHGTCDQYTKRCLCEAFWMEDVIRLYLGDNESNCDWSILYVIVISFTVVVTITALFWTFVCCITKFNDRKRASTRHGKRYRKSNRNRYTLLEDDYTNDITAVDRMELLSNNVKQINSQTYFSDEDSLSETLFDSTVQRNNMLNKLNGNNHNHQKHHQKSLNGLVKDNRKVRA